MTTLVLQSYSYTSPEVQIWDLDKGVPLSTLPGHEGGVHAIDLSLEGNQIVSGGDDAIVGRVGYEHRQGDRRSFEDLTGRSVRLHSALTACECSSGGPDRTVRIRLKDLPMSLAE